MDPSGTELESNISDSSSSVESDTVSKKNGRQGGAIRHRFTWFNYPENYGPEIKERFEGKNWITSEEVCPTTGNPHIQGYVEHGAKCRPIEKYKLDKQISWHACARNCTRRMNVDYVCKTRPQDSMPSANIQGTLTPIRFKIKTLAPSLWYDWQKEVVALVRGEQNDRTINVFWEAEGNRGKSAIGKYCCIHEGAIMLSGKTADMKYAVQQYVLKNNEGPKCIIIDIPRSNFNYVNWGGIEEVKGGCFFSGKYEGGQVYYENPTIIVFCNQVPDLTECSKDRWIIKHIV